jgi:5,5'-dehydrodivanillate O-demethylase
MVTVQENELMTRVGPGTAAGELLRRYWQPICFAKELTDEKPLKRVRLLAEDLVLFRNPQGEHGLLGEHCSHRGTSLYYGFVEEAGLRCPYHGWLYDGGGKCTEQPFEPAESLMKHTIRHPAYPVEELGGLLWTYMGPPARKPLLPRWDVIVREDGERRWEVRPLDCNWLQAMENTPDFVHTYYLHGHNMHVRGLPGGEYFYRPFEKYGFRRFEWGLVKLWSYDGDDPESGWGHPLIFPNMQRALEGRGDAMHWRVPIDDTHTQIFVCTFIRSRDGRPQPQPAEPEVEYYDHQRQPDGEYALTSFPSQDHMAWETEGAIFDRTAERLGSSDLGIALFRDILREQIDLVQEGGDPMGLVRDEHDNNVINVIVREVGLPDDADQVNWVYPDMVKSRELREVK